MSDRTVSSIEELENIVNNMTTEECLHYVGRNAEYVDGWEPIDHDFCSASIWCSSAGGDFDRRITRVLATRAKFPHVKMRDLWKKE
jgi:hypothetical protein